MPSKSSQWHGLRMVPCCVTRLSTDMRVLSDIRMVYASDFERTLARVVEPCRRFIASCVVSATPL